MYEVRDSILSNLTPPKNPLPHVSEGWGIQETFMTCICEALAKDPVFHVKGVVQRDG